MRNIAFAAGLMGLALPLAAQANMVTIQNITGTWSNVAQIAPQNFNISGSGTANPEVRWGVDRGDGQSGYDFSAAAGPIDVTVPPSPSPDFVLGTFTHLNRIIGFPSITGVRLTVNAQIVIEGEDQGFRNFVFNFTHVETDNDALPCPFGPAGLSGVNSAGCADRVTVAVSGSTQVFEVDGEIYTLNIRGFEVDGVFATQFLSAEDQDNSANLIAQVTLRDAVIPTPMSLALFGLALAGFGAVASRRRA
jgi:hypothetical protein